MSCLYTHSTDSKLPDRKENMDRVLEQQLIIEKSLGIGKFANYYPEGQEDIDEISELTKEEEEYQYGKEMDRLIDSER